MKGLLFAALALALPATAEERTHDEVPLVAALSRATGTAVPGRIHSLPSYREKEAREALSFLSRGQGASRAEVHRTDLASAAPASATGSDQAQFRNKETAAAPATQPAKKPTRSFQVFFSRSWAPSVSGWLRDSVSSSASTVLVKLPVITAVEGARGTARRKRAN